MKKILLSAALLSASTFSMAEAPGGPNCGWGNLLLQGQSGLVPHFVALTTNGSSGNGTIGMTFGTNGCSVDGTLSYGGDSLVWFDKVLDEYSTDVAVGEGETLNAVAVMVGVNKQDRPHFYQLMHENFTSLFPNTEVSSQDVLDSMLSIMADDATLEKYVG